MADKLKPCILAEKGHLIEKKVEKTAYLYRHTLFELFRKISKVEEFQPPGSDEALWKVWLGRFTLPHPPKILNKSDVSSVREAFDLQNLKELGQSYLNLMENHFSMHQLLRGALEALLELAWQGEKECLRQALVTIEEALQCQFQKLEKEREALYPPFNGGLSKLSTSQRKPLSKEVSIHFKESRLYFENLYHAYRLLQGNIRQYLLGTCCQGETIEPSQELEHTRRQILKEAEDQASPLFPFLVHEGRSLDQTGKKILSSLRLFEETMHSALKESECLHKAPEFKASLTRFVKDAHRELVQQLYILTKKGVFSAGELKKEFHPEKIDPKKVCLAEKIVLVIGKRAELQVRQLETSTERCMVLIHRFWAAIDS